MIAIKKSGTAVHVTLEGGPLETTYSFSFDCKDEYYAELLKIHFQNKLYNKIESVRSQEYNRGYKDGRSKKAKVNWFWGSLKNI